MKTALVLALKKACVKVALLVSVLHPLIEAFEDIAFFMRLKTKKPPEKKVEQQFGLPVLVLLIGAIFLLRGLSAYTRR